MRSTVDFESSLFTPFLPEDSQVNPQTYGAELAWWLSRKLAEQGTITSYPNYEDWGWFIEYITDAGDEFWLCCSNCDESKAKWRCFVQPKGKGLFGRNKAKIEHASPLIQALQTVLDSEPEIQNIQWGSDQ